MHWRRALLLAGSALTLLGAALLWLNWPADSSQPLSETMAWYVRWPGFTSLVLGILGLFGSIVPEKLLTIFIIPELRQKILLTILFLAIYRIGFSIPLPFVNQNEMNKMLAGAGGALGNILGFVSMFSGGNLSQATI